MSRFQDAKRVVVKVGSSTLTHHSGHFNIRRVEQLVKVLADIQNSGKEVILVVNKVDSPSKAYEIILDFYELGFGEPVPISAANMTNIGDLLDRIVAWLIG